MVRLLLDLGVLSRVAGDEDAFVRDDGDALYDVERRVLAALLASPRGPSTITAAGHEERLAALTEELPATTDDLRNRQIRHRLTRRLLDEPVLYHDDLDDAELAYLTGQRHAITSRITELTGLVAEVRAEGIAMVDPQDDLTDVRMPETGTEGHVTLLLAEHLAAADGPVPLPDAARPRPRRRPRRTRRSGARTRPSPAPRSSSPRRRWAGWRRCAWSGGDGDTVRALARAGALRRGRARQIQESRR